MSRLWMLLVLCLPLDHAYAYPHHAQSLSHRSIIYFSPQHDEHVKRFLLETLMNECALRERDIVTLVITEDGQSEPGWVKEHFDLGVLFNAYRIHSDQHTAILIDKDGQEKLRWGKSTDWQTLKQVIDNTDLGKQEKKRRQDPCSI
ncbi:hypothetical protein VII00023_01880 [Vibrio ichthyoenteri ATCC 700023]|uniref:DUF4174 domain-containing protein n=1 Tax=Vibrio ichthyoenteri ATCC 700023 TaxID=870968 RepID=F9S3S0_9VIBR|nr:DUF4174 domain-containing protein [Vibrio ichthyoenteri]EGU37716.1 hypothetical protein VII00023_01880 [Vibrio ichthyoenteri ATCC 700023]